MIGLDDVLQMDGIVFSVWLQENRKAYGLSYGCLAGCLGVEIGAIKGYEEGYFCRQTYREALFKYFEETELLCKETLQADSVISEKLKAKAKPKMKDISFGVWLKEQRLALGMTQREFAAAIKVPAAPQISSYEHSSRIPSAQEQARIKKCVESLPRSQGSLSQKAEKPQIDGIPFGVWLKEQRLALGMAQKEFAVAIGLVCQSTISVYERGFCDPLLRTQACIEQRVKALRKSQGDQKEAKVRA